MIKVLVAGACGRMGKEVVKAVSADNELELVAAVDATCAGEDIGALAGLGADGISVSPDLKEAISSANPSVMIDFTYAEAARKNITTALTRGVHCVVGTTGLTDEDIEDFERYSQESGANVLIAPNFAIGAVLMMRFAELAARFMPIAEIIELHHDKKADAPSGTALLTAKKLAKIIEEREEPTQKEILPGSRGGELGSVRVHSVRLPGFVAHQEVIFGGTGQALTIRHDSIDRTSFMPGVVMAVKAIAGRPGLTVGLENLLGI